MDDKDIEAIMEKSRKKFLRDLEDKIHNAMINLLRYNYSHSQQKRKKELIKFFHSIKGTASNLDFPALAEVGEEYEDILKEAVLTEDDLILKVVEGLAKVYKNHNTYLKRKEPKKVVAKENEKILLDSEYTNLTTSGKILMIDNDVELLELLERVLREYGYQILITSEPKEGLRILEEEKIDLVLLDIILSETDGFSLFKKMRRMDFQEPVIFLSARDKVDDKVRGLELGAEDYIIKPFEMKELKARIESVLEKYNNFKNKIIKDQLTDAYTKNYFQERAQEEKERFGRGDKRFSVAFIDLDDFKAINDNYGHLIGDEVLKEFAQFLFHNLRKIDQVHRFGGDEFLVLFPETTAKEAYTVLKRLKGKFVKYDFNNLNLAEKIEVGFSSGIAEIKDSTDKIQDLLEEADQALYDVKQNNKGEIKISDQVSETRENKEILIIDDENVIVDLIRTRLNSLGYNIRYSNNSKKGISLVEKNKPELIILDLMLPELNGVEVIKELKDNQNTEDIKIIVLSSEQSEEDIKHTFNLGVDDYLAKPFSLAELEDRVKRII